MEEKEKILKEPKMIEIKKGKLTPKRKLFLEEYLKDFNSKRASNIAGYKGRNPNSTVYSIMKHPEAKEMAEVAQEKKKKLLGVDGRSIIEEIRNLSFFDVSQIMDEGGALLPFSKIPPEMRRCIAGIEIGRDEFGYVVKRIKFWDKMKAIELLCRHLGLLNDKLRIKADITTVQKIEIDNLSKLTREELMILKKVMVKVRNSEEADGKEKT